MSNEALVAKLSELSHLLLENAEDDAAVYDCIDSVLGICRVEMLNTYHGHSIHEIRYKLNHLIIYSGDSNEFNTELAKVLGAIMYHYSIL